MKSDEEDQFIAPPHPSRTAKKSGNLRYFSCIAYRGGPSSYPSLTVSMKAMGSQSGRGKSDALKSDYVRIAMDSF
ncbi:hypothetical protein E3N88_07643 [Mikania micrantha]|uniref:Uncharacterized protein n=1 Tax=Mikania micrantha TaxID=192012 RepID=A0A5N6PU89_9ASTR|nr:hypothetical protein E3N88_07643 [Mikania micrantha]